MEFMKCFGRPFQSLNSPLHVSKLILCLSSCGIWRDVQQPRERFGTIPLTQNNLLNRNGLQQVLDNVLHTSFQTSSSSLSLSHFDVFRLYAQTPQPSLPSAKPLPPSLRLCVIPNSHPCNPLRLDSTVWSRTETSLSFVAEVAFETHMRRTSTRLLVCRPTVVLRHTSTCPQVICSNSDLSHSAICAVFRPLV